MCAKNVSLTHTESYTFSQPARKASLFCFYFFFSHNPHKRTGPATKSQDNYCFQPRNRARALGPPRYCTEKKESAPLAEESQTGVSHQETCERWRRSILGQHLTLRNSASTRRLAFICCVLCVCVWTRQRLRDERATGRKGEKTGKSPFQHLN